MFSALYLLIHNLFNQETSEEKKNREIFNQEYQRAKYKVIEESNHLYCDKCNSFIAPDCYSFFIRIYTYKHLRCLFCGEDITTANNVAKVYKHIREGE